MRGIGRELKGIRMSARVTAKNVGHHDRVIDVIFRNTSGNINRGRFFGFHDNLSDFEIVLGKYLALLAQLAFLFLPTLSYVGVLRALHVNVDYGMILAGVLGFFLLGSSFLAIGLLFSALTESQVLAASLTFVSLLGLWMLEWFTGFLPYPWNTRLGILSPFFHYRDFSLGIVDLADVTYFLCLIAFFFFLSLRVVETRNWKG